jgi:uncharacterized protein
MPVDWWRPQDIDRLADREARIEFDEPLQRFPRLRAMCVPRGPDARLAEQVDGRARGSVRVFRDGRRPTAELAVSADFPLQCQRCLRPMLLPVSAASRIRLQDAEGDPGGTEAVLSGADIEDTFLVEHGRIVLPELVEEELLLALPLIARHDDENECARAADDDASPTVTRGDAATKSPVKGLPFAGLGELLKRPR